MSYLLTNSRPQDVALYLLYRDHPDTPPEFLPEGWLFDALDNHFQRLFNPYYGNDPDDEHELTAENIFQDPDETLTKMLLGEVNEGDGNITYAEVSPAPFRFVHIETQAFVFPCIFVDIYGAFRP
ncbi:hypothetical protein JOAD_23 [Erwinia phage vB_EamM_Joad]|uniref:Uncharacterized protein n=1 Tax=Erwinia phage vB_EamM_Joad TaxID=2026081 RepID=A0A223LIU0_9CAUD|nr:hypothetical protein JOAD_23 [Erwinia phage vB_EamM_Joad]